MRSGLRGDRAPAAGCAAVAERRVWCLWWEGSTNPRPWAPLQAGSKHPEPFVMKEGFTENDGETLKGD